jgi:formylmethanofuran dehydrogenase subunit C
VSEWVTLTLRAPLDAAIVLDGVRPDRFAEMSAHDVESTVVTQGRRAAKLGDFFTVAGERAARVRIEGSRADLHGIGAGMRGGELVVDGDLGDRAAAGMTGGVIHIRGNAGDEAGIAMAGGVLRIDGNAGDRLGGALPGASKGMTGGEIVVLGSAGAEAAARVRRGLIAVGGNVGPDAARSIIAGTLVVLGACGRDPGRGSKRGSIVACGEITVPQTYRYACTFTSSFVRVTLIYLQRRFGIQIDPTRVAGAYRRYCGDAAEPVKGEILALIRSDR